MDDLSKKIDEALGSFKKGKNRLYLYIVKNKFDAITKLLEEGNTLTSLFEHLVECGILPESGNPESLRRAYNREKARRIGNKERKYYGTQEQKADSTTVSAPDSTIVPVTVQAEKTEKSEDEKLSEEDRKRIERLRQKARGTVIDTGTSSIFRRTDGGFDIT